MPLQRRLPKFGFKNLFRTRWATINVSDLVRFAAGDVVDEAALRRAGLIKGSFDGIKVLGDGELDRALTIHAHKFSAGAADKIVAAGGKAEVIGG